MSTANMNGGKMSGSTFSVYWSSGDARCTRLPRELAMRAVVALARQGDVPRMVEHRADGSNVAVPVGYAVHQARAES